MVCTRYYKRFKQNYKKFNRDFKFFFGGAAAPILMSCTYKLWDKYYSLSAQRERIGLQNDIFEQEKRIREEKGKSKQDLIKSMEEILSKFLPAAVTQKQRIELLKYAIKAEDVLDSVKKDALLSKEILKGTGNYDDITLFLRLSISLANSYLYRDIGKDPYKAKLILEQAEEVIENYISVKCKSNLKFKDITDKRLLSSVLDDYQMREIYVKVCYFTGRIYLYFKTEKEKITFISVAKECLEKAQYLAEKDKLFEFYQSQAVGLGIIERDEIIRKLKKQELTLKESIKALENLLRLYDTLLHDKTKYSIVHYKHQEDTVVYENARCLIDCWEQKIKCYAELLKIDATHWVQKAIDDFTKNFKIPNQDSLFMDNKKVASTIVVLSSLLFTIQKQPDFIIDQATSKRIAKWLHSNKIKELNSLADKSNDFFVLSLALLDVAYNYSSQTEVGMIASNKALIFLKQHNNAQQLEILWKNRQKETERYLDALPRVAGDISEHFLKNAMLLQDLEINAELLNIEIIGILPRVNHGSKLLIIDSDKNTRNYASKETSVEVSYTAVQEDTASCGDNALIAALKAKSIGLKSYVYIQNNNAVAVIILQDGAIRQDVLTEIDNIELDDNKEVWNIYKEVIVNTGTPTEALLPQTQTSKSNNSSISSFLETIKIISNGFQDLSAYVNYRSDVLYRYIDNLITYLDNIIPETDIEESLLFQAINNLSFIRESYCIPMVPIPPSNNSDDPDDFDGYLGNVGLQDNTKFSILNSNNITSLNYDETIM